MYKCIGIIEFDREVNCTGGVLGKSFKTSICGLPVEIFTPKAADYSSDNIFDCLISPDGLSGFRVEWGHVYRRPDIIAGLRTVGISVELDMESRNTIYESIEEWKTKIEDIFLIMMDNPVLNQKGIRFDKTNNGGINYHTGLRLFVVNNDKLNEVRNPFCHPTITVNLVSENSCLNYNQFMQAFEMADSEIPISQTYTLLLVAYKAFMFGDFRSAVILGGSAIENCILQKIFHYCIDNGIELKTPIGELRKKFKKLKEFSIKIPIENYQNDVIDIRNDVVHKGRDIREKKTLEFLEKCRILINEYEPSIIGNDINELMILPPKTGESPCPSPNSRNKTSPMP